jgi:protein SCO1
MKRWIWLGISLFTGVAIAFGIVLLRPYTFRGSVIDKPTKAPDFTLTDANGNSFRLSDQVNKPVLLFFGYTQCPDVCPATVLEYKQIRASLGAKADQVILVLVSVDPANDSPDVMKTYLARVDPKIVGLTGTIDQLTPVWKDYGVYRKTSDPSENTPEKLEEHSAAVYGIDKKGNLRVTYTFGTPYEDMEQDLLFLIRE